MAPSRILAAFALTTALTLPTATQAHHLPETTAWKTQQSLPVADAAWPQSPCAGKLNLLNTPDATAKLTAHGGYYFGNCDIAVRETLEPAAYCSALVHEAGHAAGMNHSDNPASIMNADHLALYPACDKFPEQPTHFLAYIRENTQRWTRHTWRCRGGTTRQRCVGKPRNGARMTAEALFAKERIGVALELWYR